MVICMWTSMFSCCDWKKKTSSRQTVKVLWASIENIPFDSAVKFCKVLIKLTPERIVVFTCLEFVCSLGSKSCSLWSVFLFSSAHAHSVCRQYNKTLVPPCVVEGCIHETFITMGCKCIHFNSVLFQFNESTDLWSGKIFINLYFHVSDDELSPRVSCLLLNYWIKKKAQNRNNYKTNTTVASLSLIMTLPDASLTHLDQQKHTCER